jgi:hypothetical protein
MASARISRTLVALLVFASCSTVSATAPKGWIVAGTRPADYQTAVDKSVTYNNHPSAYIKSLKPTVDGFGTLMQQFGAERYTGKRIRLTGYVKADSVQDWAGVWMRVDGGQEMVAFDNMQDRPIKGTTEWTKCVVVLDVPPSATAISLGILLNGSGTVWLNSVQIETVGLDVPVTGKQKAPSNAPMNLLFEE